MPSSPSSNTANRPTGPAPTITHSVRIAPPAADSLSLLPTRSPGRRPAARGGILPDGTLPDLMPHALESPLLPVVRDFRELQAQARPFVLATILGTDGSTYRKAGTPMLITATGEPRGLLS